MVDISWISWVRSGSGVVSGSLGFGPSPEAELFVCWSETICMLCSLVLCRFRFANLGNTDGQRLHVYLCGARCCSLLGLLREWMERKTREHNPQE